MGRRGGVAIAVIVLLLGAMASGLASVAAERIPFTAREGGLEHHSLPELLYFALLTLVDTYVGWAVIPVLLGYTAARSPRWAAGMGALFAVLAYGAYALRSHIAHVVGHRERMADDVDLPPDVVEQLVPPTPLEAAMTVVTHPMFLIAVVGAGIVGMAGYHARRYPLLLLVLPLAVAMDFWRRADTPWLSVTNGTANVVLVVTGLATIIWALAAHRARRGALLRRE
jgi:hypothetical protein